VVKALREALASRGFACTESALESFRAYRELVLQQNARVNLTAITDAEQFEIKHFVDSVLCIDQPELLAAREVVDIGTGAGFPGIPLAILLPAHRFTLIDSLGKRVRVLEEIVSRLGLKNVRPVCGRAEDLARDASLREAFDLCVSRAVARLSVLAEYCLPFVRVGGFFFAYKGADVAEEVAAAERAISVLGGAVREIGDASLAAYGLWHKLVVAEKTGPTPSKYPRRAGAPERRPL
jgi:16S rRNA (guanine527-N7)-methyltransferase